MDMDFTVTTETFVKLRVTTSKSNTYGAEKSFDKSLTIGDLKQKLVLMTGANVATMKLEIFNEAGGKVCNLDMNDALLGSYPVDSGMILNVIDKFFNEFEDPTVEKFELSSDQYAQRNDTLKAHLERNKLGKYNPEREEQLKLERDQLEALENELAAQLKVGDRCEVQNPSQPTRRGTIQYVGNVHFQKGMWVGIQLDEPFGKNDGSVGDQRYFTCPPKYGSFVKVQFVKSGDFPIDDPFADEI